MFFYDQKDHLVAKLAHVKGKITKIVGYSSQIDNFVKALLTGRKKSGSLLIEKVSERPLA